MLQRINLVPQDPLKDKVKKTVSVALLVFVSFVCLFIYIRMQILDRRIHAADQKIQVVEKQSQLSGNLQLTIGDLNKKIIDQKKEYEELQKRMAKLDKMTAEKSRFSDILAHIASSVPQSVSLSHCTLNDSSGEIAGSTLRQQDLPKLIMKIKKDPRFVAVELQNMKKADVNSLEPFTFTIKFSLKNP